MSKFSKKALVLGYTLLSLNIIAIALLMYSLIQVSDITNPNNAVTSIKNYLIGVFVVMLILTFIQLILILKKGSEFAFMLLGFLYFLVPTFIIIFPIYHLFTIKDEFDLSNSAYVTLATPFIFLVLGIGNFIMIKIE